MMIQFADKMVTYDTFLNDLAARVVAMMGEDAKTKKAFMSQAEAIRVYGKANVLRWKDKGLIEPRKTSGKLEYDTVRLRELSRRKQDYL